MAALDGLAVVLPCITALSNGWGCSIDAAPDVQTRTVDGDPATTYAVTLRVRGVIEQNGFDNGAPLGAAYEGGNETNASWAVFRIDVSDPPEHYFLNPGAAGTQHCFVLDYAVELPVAGGAEVVLTADGGDTAQTLNIDASGTPLSVPGAIVKQPYDGQWVQIDVEAVAAP
jgi:hypothetical protein